LKTEHRTRKYQPVADNSSACQETSGLPTDKEADLRAEKSFLNAVNVVATLVAIIGVDRVGRRFLFITSGIAMVACEVVVGVCLGYYFHNNHGVLPDNVSNGVLAVICFYVANFAWSWWVPSRASSKRKIR